MEDSGQVYADLFGDAPEADRRRMEQALDKLEREEIERAIVLKALNREELHTYES